MTRKESLFAAAACLMCVALAGFAVSVLGVPLGDLSPYLDGAGLFAPQAAIGAGLIAILYAFMRLRAMAVIALATAALGLAVVWPAREIASCAPGAAPHRIVFLNLWNGNGEIDATMAYLATLNADVIVLVEMRPKFMSAVDTLTQDFPYRSACPGNCTALILSRRPMSEITSQVSEPSGPRSLAAARISYPDGTLNLVGVHLYRPWPFNQPLLQEGEAHSLARTLSALKEPRLVLGDFNAVPWGAVLRRLTRDASLTPLAGRGTWRTNLPSFLRLPIDHALTGSGMSCATKKVGRRVGSDHRPVIVDFALNS